MPAFAPDVRPIVDALGWGKGLCIEVDDASNEVADASKEVDVAVLKDEVLLAETVVEVVVELVLGAEDVEVEVETIPSSVDTIAPSPLRTMPRLSAQHDASLSQQKLPSEQVTTRGRKPVPVTIAAL
jgi:hypothetical protein